MLKDAKQTGFKLLRVDGGASQMPFRCLMPHSTLASCQEATCSPIGFIGKPGALHSMQPLDMTSVSMYKKNSGRKCGKTLKSDRRYLYGDQSTWKLLLWGRPLQPA